MQPFAAILELAVPAEPTQPVQFVAFVQLLQALGQAERRKLF